MKRDELRRLTRDELLVRAEALGVARPAVLTQAELIDEILQRSGSRDDGMRGWLGRARDLVSQVVSKGLHLPDAAKAFRSDAYEPLPVPPPPLPTVTLAEIYAAQGHVAKAIGVLDQVLEREPSHPLAPELRVALLSRLRGEPTTGRRLGAFGLGLAASGRTSTPDMTSSDASPPVFRDGLAMRAIAPTCAECSWELRPVRLARALALEPRGRLVVRLLSVLARSGTIERHDRDVAVDGSAGSTTVSEIEPGSHIRSCLGWKSPEAFVPLVVGPAVTMPTTT